MKKGLLVLINVLLVLFLVTPVLAESGTVTGNAAQGGSVSAEFTQEELAKLAGAEGTADVKYSYALVINKVANEAVDGYTTLATYDVTFHVLGSDGSDTQVAEPGKAVNVTVTLPEAPAVESGATREWKLVANHNGTKVESTPTVSGTTGSFSSDKFSTFTFAYKDTKNAEPSNNNNNNGYNVVNTADAD